MNFKILICLVSVLVKSNQSHTTPSNYNYHWYRSKQLATAHTRLNPSHNMEQSVNFYDAPFDFETSDLSQNPIHILLRHFQKVTEQKDDEADALLEENIRLRAQVQHMTEHFVTISAKLEQLVEKKYEAIETTQNADKPNFTPISKMTEEQLKTKCKETGILSHIYRTMSVKEMRTLLMISSADKLDLSCYTKEKLIEMCKIHSIKGYSSLSKEDLEAYIVKKLSLIGLVGVFTVRDEASGSKKKQPKENLALADKFAKMKKDELIAYCKDNKIRGYSGKNIAELVELIIFHQ